MIAYVLTKIMSVIMKTYGNVQGRHDGGGFGPLTPRRAETAPPTAVYCKYELVVVRYNIVHWSTRSY